MDAHRGISRGAQNEPRLRNRGRCDASDGRAAVRRSTSTGPACHTRPSCWPSTSRPITVRAIPLLAPAPPRDLATSHRFVVAAVVESFTSNRADTKSRDVPREGPQVASWRGWMGWTSLLRVRHVSSRTHVSGSRWTKKPLTFDVRRTNVEFLQKERKTGWHMMAGRTGCRVAMDSPHCPCQTLAWPLQANTFFYSFFVGRARVYGTPNVTNEVHACNTTRGPRRHMVAYSWCG